jgi:protocatechuate 3,4-dioxygenase beta subunit
MSSVLICLVAISAAPPPGTLVGRITDAEGRSIGDARVDLWTARPKVGVGST